MTEITISLWQPWASLIAAGVKTSETRSWKPPAALLGERIAFQATQRPMTFRDVDNWPPTLQRAVLDINGDLDNREAWPLGAVVATARLVTAGQVDTRLLVDPEAYARLHGCYPPIADSHLCACREPGGGTFNVWDDGLGDYSAGRWVWMLEDVEPLPEPIPARGFQGFWNWEEAPNPPKAGWG